MADISSEDCGRKKRVQKALTGGVIVWALLGVACGSLEGGSLSSSGSSSGESGVEYIGEGLEGGAVTRITLDDEGQGELDLGELSGSEDYVLAVYHYDADGASSSVTVGAANESGRAPAALQADSGESLEDLTENFHEVLRNSENGLDKDASLINQPKALRRAESLVVGSTRTFKVLDSLSSTDTFSDVEAELMYFNDDVSVYMDTRDIAISESNGFGTEDITALMEDFTVDVDAMRDLLGEESDINNDNHFSILFTRAVNQLGGSSGGIITGFFYAVDLFSADDYPQSNEEEILYTYVPDPDGELGGSKISVNFSMSNIYPSVFPHEYQHMVNFRAHSLDKGGDTEEAWMNEALSHLMEGRLTQTGDTFDYMETMGVENPSRVSGYLADIDGICFTCGASLYQRGGSFLFIRYLYEQAEKGLLTGVDNGAELIQNLVLSNHTGMENVVESVTGSTDFTDETAEDLLGRYALAVLMDDTGLSSDDRFQFDIELRASQDDNRGTVLHGPGVVDTASLPLSATVAGTSVGYYQISGEQIINEGGTLRVDAGSNSGAFLIQIGL